ncbi:hypothetical protein M430DRAFT_36986 [Amorphotheca resinae ATCC 22711]|uniref:Uncharacterized protein n=1 Tax=Amorphotheca resinae ATCC 22711 TaxID=857342 RepID=A0A2T3ATJ1_AMORE|nr:hypothetical protein M430DRAFT_36986 [Amorphotheca resinae ATCC 22711]PSS10772.1 hypothetical protein M430DRAFT_36986 [Amorphotheca resinae ATCC 22711]
MVILRSLPARAARSNICAQCMRSSITSFRPLTTSSQSTTRLARRSTFKPLSSPVFSCAPQLRSYATKSTADDLIEEIQEQYATARDEFEIAAEETEKKSVYAEEDRAAAREELDNLKALYEKALESADAEEVKRRVGQRIRELDNAVEALEKSALEE